GKRHLSPDLLSRPTDRSAAERQVPKTTGGVRPSSNTSIRWRTDFDCHSNQLVYWRAPTGSYEVSDTWPGSEGGAEASADVEDGGVERAEGLALHRLLRKCQAELAAAAAEVAGDEGLHREVAQHGDPEVDPGDVRAVGEVANARQHPGGLC